MSDAGEVDAILLLAHGTPDVLGEMAEYLGKVTGGRPLPAEVVEELQHRYAEIGLREEPLAEGPPLTKWTLLQGRLLGEALGMPVYVGMRNWHPFIADVLAQMRADGVRRFRAVCLAPQNSRTSVGLYRKATSGSVRAKWRWSLWRGGASTRGWRRRLRWSFGLCGRRLAR